MEEREHCDLETVGGIEVDVGRGASGCVVHFAAGAAELEELPPPLSWEEEGSVNRDKSDNTFPLKLGREGEHTTMQLIALSLQTVFCRCSLDFGYPPSSIFFVVYLDVSLNVLRNRLRVHLE